MFNPKNNVEKEGQNHDMSQRILTKTYTSKHKKQKKRRNKPDFRKPRRLATLVQPFLMGTTIWQKQFIVNPPARIETNQTETSKSLKILPSARGKTPNAQRIRARNSL